MTEVVVVDSPDSASSLAAELILSKVRTKPALRLGVATGATPVSLYRRMAVLAKQFGIDLGELQAYALDEYVGLEPGSPQSFRHFLEEHFIEVLGLDSNCLVVPSGDVGTIATAGDHFEKAIRDTGGIDCQILGIGSNGHIGFNEPGSSLGSRTRVKTLTENTRRDNAAYFSQPEDVPVHCISQGIGTILEARALVMLAFGDKKAEAVASAVEGPISASCPASAIQLHPHATVILDEGAASRLEQLRYYKFVWENKPDWQSWRLS